jgi:hypothetical protein
MAATAGSLYQATAAAHQAGNPPNADYQRTTETYAAYTARMWANELPPDINPTESDADYLTRLATYSPAVVVGATGNVNVAAGVTASFTNGIFTGIIA